MAGRGGTGEEFASRTKERVGLKHLLRLFNVTYELFDEINVICRLVVKVKKVQYYELS